MSELYILLIDLALAHGFEQIQRLVSFDLRTASLGDLRIQINGSSGPATDPSGDFLLDVREALVLRGGLPIAQVAPCGGRVYGFTEDELIGCLRAELLAGAPRAH